MESKLNDDVFISYAQLDDEDGWISKFHRALEIRLGQLLGQLPGQQPWIRRELKPQSDGFSPDPFVDGLPAAFISVLTPRYLQSAACLRELAGFSRAVDEVRAGDPAGIFKVVQTPVPPGNEPNELQRLRGYEFFAVDPDTGQMREPGRLSDSEAGQLFWLKLDDLAQDIRRLLQRRRGGHESVENASASPGAGSVYLADTSFDLRQERDAIRRDLVRHGYKVLPDRPAPRSAPELKAFVKEQLASCQLSVHLMGRHYGAVPEGAGQSVAVLENDLATARWVADSHFSRFIWKPIGCEPQDDRHQAFLARLESDATSLGGAEIFETGFEEFKAAIHDRLEHPPPVSKTRFYRGHQPRDKPRAIYLVHDQRDGDATDAIAGFLHKHGFQVRRPLFVGGEAEVRANHQSNLLSQAALIYYGEGSQTWLRQMVRDLRKSAGYGRSEPLRAMAVLVAPPETAEKKGLTIRDVPVLRQEGTFQPAILENFVRSTGQSVARRATAAGNPFPGRRSFEPDEDLLFFGRERQTDQLLERLRSSRFLAVIGAGGSGKTSLLRSGLVPALHAGSMVSAGSQWRVVQLRPGENPIGNLAAAVASWLLGRDDCGSTGRAIAEATLRSSARGLTDSVLEANLPPHSNVLVVVEHFEDLFRSDDRAHSERATEDAGAFVRLLLRAASQRETPLYIAITLHAGFVSDCTAFPGLAEAINEGHFLVPRMSRKERRAAITGPIAVAGANITPRLVTRMLNDFDDSDQLAIFQHALMRTWDRWSGDHDDGEPLDLRHYPVKK